MSGQCCVCMLNHWDSENSSSLGMFRVLPDGPNTWGISRCEIRARSRSSWGTLTGTTGCLASRRRFIFSKSTVHERDARLKTFSPFSTALSPSLSSSFWATWTRRSRGPLRYERMSRLRTRTNNVFYEMEVLQDSRREEISRRIPFLSFSWLIFCFFLLTEAAVTRIRDWISRESRLSRCWCETSRHEEVTPNCPEHYNGNYIHVSIRITVTHASHRRHSPL